MVWMAALKSVMHSCHWRTHSADGTLVSRLVTQDMLLPPSTGMAAPVTFEALSDARNAATVATFSRLHNAAQPDIAATHSVSRSAWEWMDD